MKFYTSEHRQVECLDTLEYNGAELRDWPLGNSPNLQEVNFIMSKAFILMETMVGRTREIANQMSNLEGVKSVDLVTGPYDIIAVVEADTLNQIGDIITQVIHPIGGISRTVTCLAI
jgi:DNA-binding Lrp family transcriptional regulator